MAMLMAAECESVVEALAISAYHEGGELHAHLRNGARIVMAVRGGRRGVWLDKSDMQGGDTLELVHRVLGQEDHRVAYDWGRRFFGMPGGSEAVRALAERRDVIRARQAKAVEDKQSFTARVRAGLARYLSGERAWPHVPEIRAYLAGRGIDWQKLPAGPRTLRFSRGQYHVESGREWPAMLAPIIDPLCRQIIAAHVTFLAGGGGNWHKAPIAPVKKASARYKGGVIPLLHGASGKPLQFAPDGETVLIAEGIENALAAAIMLAPGEPEGIDPRPRVFAAVSAPNLPHIRLPPQFAEVVMIGDRWEAGYANPAVVRAYDLAERAWLDAGLAVKLQMPPKGFRDFAEALAANL